MNLEQTPTPQPPERQLEESLRASEERFRVAFEQSVIGMVLADLDGRVEQVNDAFCRIVGRSPEELIGQTSFEFTHPDDREVNTEEIRRLREGQIPNTTYNKRYIRKDGSIVWTRLNLTRIASTTTSRSELLATVEDISEQKRAEMALGDSERRLRLIFESITDYAIITIDQQGTVTGWNPGAENIFGYSASEIIGQSSSILWNAEDRANNVPALEREKAVREGRALDERWHLRKGEERFYASGVMRPMYGRAGELEGFTKICRDLTAQVLAEEELATARAQVAASLETQRARLIEIFQRAPSFLAILQGPEHIFELVNERYYQLVGHRNLLHKPLRDALPEVREQGFIDLLDRVYATGESYIGKDLRVFLQREPGMPMEECYVDVVYQPIRNPDGTIIGIFAHGVDVTDRILAQQSLAQHVRTYETILSAIRDYVFIFDREGRFTYANKILLELWGLPAEQAIGKTMTELEYAEDIKAQLMGEIERVFTTSRVATGELAYTSPVGKGGHFEYILAPVLDPEGNVESIAGTSRDISERKRVEAEREQLLERERAARTDAERASRMKDEFLATLSHELRTPLNAILGWATILRDEPTQEDLAAGIQAIERNARAQTQIIEDLLDMSRIISGKVRLHVQRIDLAPVVEAAIETIRPAAEAKGVRLHSVLDPLARPVSGDPNRLQQVFWNLLSNAVKFTPRGGLIQVLLERINSHLEVSVSDTGEGIRPEFLPHVFDRFRQADASTTRRHGGLGIGLALVKQLVELHGGTANVRSAGIGCGSTFSVMLPLTVLLPEASSDETRQHPQAAHAPVFDPSTLNLGGLKVLVVDDEPDARSLVARLLEGFDAVVRTAGSAAEAMELFQQETPDVLVSDIGMPNEDGYTLIRRIRELGPEKGGGVPALALTAYARAEDRMKAVLAGFQMHVTKPVEAAELLTMVASLAGRTP